MSRTFPELFYRHVYTVRYHNHAFLNSFNQLYTFCINVLHYCPVTNKKGLQVLKITCKPFLVYTSGNPIELKRNPDYGEAL